MRWNQRIHCCFVWWKKSFVEYFLKGVWRIDIVLVVVVGSFSTRSFLWVHNGLTMTTFWIYTNVVPPDNFFDVIFLKIHLWSLESLRVGLHNRNSKTKDLLVFRWCFVRSKYVPPCNRTMFFVLNFLCGRIHLFLNWSEDHIKERLSTGIAIVHVVEEAILNLK